MASISSNAKESIFGAKGPMAFGTLKAL